VHGDRRKRAVPRLKRNNDTAEYCCHRGVARGSVCRVEAKHRDPEASVALISEEPSEPYERPPLLKAVLLGKVRAADAPIAGPKGLAGHGVNLECNTRCTDIDRAAREIVTASGRRFGYDALVIATGSLVREIHVLSLGTPHIHYLRTEAHARALADKLKTARHLVVVGGGLIGLEVAASAAELGVKVTVIDATPPGSDVRCEHASPPWCRHPPQRRGDPCAGHGGRPHRAQNLHQRDIDCRSYCGRRGRATGRSACRGGGARKTESLSTPGGTSDPDIYAAGDAARFPGPNGLMHREDWRHAQDQGVVAGRNGAGANDEYRSVPVVS
jgi:NADH dehydrogenase FAD-containing subunit